MTQESVCRHCGEPVVLRTVLPLKDAAPDVDSQVKQWWHTKQGYLAFLHRFCIDVQVAEPEDNPAEATIPELVAKASAIMGELGIPLVVLDPQAFSTELYGAIGTALWDIMPDEHQHAHHRDIGFSTNWQAIMEVVNDGIASVVLPPGPWQPGDPCRSCGSHLTTLGYCEECGASDDDE